MSLIRLGKWTLHSGDESTFNLEADQFIEDNLEGLVQLIRTLVGPFSSVEGIPRGGLRLAKALRSFAGLTGPHLLTDDVLTTGRSMDHHLHVASATYNRVVGAVVFARGQRPYWVKAIFDMPQVFWTRPLMRG